MESKIVKPDENKFLLNDCLYNAFHTSYIHVRRGGKIRRSFSVRRFIEKIRLVIARMLNVRTKVTFELSPDAKRNIANSCGKPYILHVICNMEIGGSQKIILDIFENMTGKYKMEILTGHLPFYVNYPDLPITVLNTQPEIAEFLRAEKPGIIHFHFWGLDAWMKMFLDTALALKEELGYRIIENSNNPIQVAYDDAIDYYAHVSQFVIDIQTGPVTPEKNTVVYPGVDTDEFRFKEVREDKLTAGMVYRLTNDKINADTIELLIKICRAVPGILIYVLGDGPNLRHFIKRSIEESVRDNICFTGVVGYGDLSRYYEKFNVFLAPVHHESYGVVVPYAMFKGNPVAAYNVDAMEELLTRDNILVKDESDFIRSVIDMLNDRIDTAALVRKNRQIAEERFSLKGMIGQYDRLYVRMITE